MNILGISKDKGSSVSEAKKKKKKHALRKLNSTTELLPTEEDDRNDAIMDKSISSNNSSVHQGSNTADIEIQLSRASVEKKHTAASRLTKLGSRCELLSEGSEESSERNSMGFSTRDSLVKGELPALRQKLSPGSK